MSTHGKPEAARLQPLAIVRPAVYCKSVGDAPSAASTLGYQHKSEHYKRGFIFTTGPVQITIYQLDTVGKTNAMRNLKSC